MKEIQYGCSAARKEKRGDRGEMRKMHPRDQGHHLNVSGHLLKGGRSYQWSSGIRFWLRELDYREGTVEGRGERGGLWRRDPRAVS